MRWSKLVPLTRFRAYLLNDQHLSESSAEAYVKQVRAFVRGMGDADHMSEDDVRRHDARLTVKMRENFRAAWQHFAIFNAGLGEPIPPAPCKIRPTGASHGLVRCICGDERGIAGTRCEDCGEIRRKV